MADIYKKTAGKKAVEATISLIEQRLNLVWDRALRMQKGLDRMTAQEKQCQSENSPQRTAQLIAAVEGLSDILSSIHGSVEEMEDELEELEDLIYGTNPQRAKRASPAPPLSPSPTRGER